jgi:hypothetical protein
LDFRLGSNIDLAGGDGPHQPGEAISAMRSAFVTFSGGDDVCQRIGMRFREPVSDEDARGQGLDFLETQNAVSWGFLCRGLAFGGEGGWADRRHFETTTAIGLQLRDLPEVRTPLCARFSTSSSEIYCAGDV